MSQATTWNVPLAGPGTMSAFAGRAGPSLDALLTQHSGSGRPSYAVAGTTWLKIVSGTQWEVYTYTGSVDILQGTYNPVAQTFTVNSSALGFATSLVARTDTTPLALVNGRVVPTQGVNGEGVIRLRGRTTGAYDEAGLVWANGNSDAAFASLLSNVANSCVRLLDGAGAEAIRFGTAGDIYSKIWGALADQIVQPGTIGLFPMTSAPSGWLNANGAVINRTTYARLWAAAQATGKLVTEAAWSGGAYGAFSTGDLSTTFRIPFLNGHFLRGVCDEVNYAIGTYVADQFAQHNHGVSDPTHNHAASSNGWALGGPSYNLASGGTAFSPNQGITVYGAATGITIQNSGSGSETKPRNVALLVCIKI